jgi:hypothetical protein
MRTFHSRVLKIVMKKIVILMNFRNKITSNSSFMKKNRIAEPLMPVLWKKIES